MGDTILSARRARVRFSGFPYHDGILHLRHASLTDAYYHLAFNRDPSTGHNRINLQYIFDALQSDKPKEEKTHTSHPFRLQVDSFTARHIRYQQDLAGNDSTRYAEGVKIEHMDFRNITLRARDIRVENSDVALRLLKMGCEEQSGFRVEQIGGDVNVGPQGIGVHDFELRTPRSTVLADVEISYDGWHALSNYLQNAQHNITLHEGTSVSLSDAAYWAPMLWGIDAQIQATGGMQGSIADMHVPDLWVSWGEQSALRMQGDVSGLPDIEQTHFNIDIQRLRTTRNDVEALGLLAGVGHHHKAHYAQLDLPDLLLNQVQYIDLQLFLHGGWEELGTVNAQLSSALGTVSADAILIPTPQGGFSFAAEVGSTAFGTGFLQSDWLTHTGFDISLNGRCAQRTDLASASAELEGRLFNSVVRGQHLAPIEVEASISKRVGNLEVQSSDSLARFNIGAEFSLSQKMKELSAKLSAEQIDAPAFGLLSEQYGPVRGVVEMSYSGSGLDTMRADLNAQGLQAGDVYINQLQLGVNADSRGKRIRLDADPIELTLSGHFSYYDLPLIAMKMAHDVVPTDIATIDTLYPEEEEMITQSNLVLHARWNDDGSLLEALGSNLHIAPGTRFDLTYNAAERLKLVGRSDAIGIGGVRIEGIGFSGRQEEAGYQLGLEAQSILVAESEWLQDAHANISSNPSQLDLDLLWDSESGLTQGDIGLRLAEGKITVERPDFSVDGRVWHLGIDSLQIVHTDRLGLHGSGITLHSDDQRLLADLQLVGSESDNLQLHFTDFRLDAITSLLIPSSQLTMAGLLGGNLSLYGLGTTPYFNANMQLDSCVVAQQPIGNLNLRSAWNAEMHTVDLALTGDAVGAEGWLELGGEHKLNIDARFDGLQLALLAPLMSTFTDRFEGMLQGKLNLSGTLNAPLIEGEALVEEGALKIDMTGVTYFFGDSLRFSNHLVRLNHFTLRDRQGNTAYVDGEIRYEDLAHITLDLGLHTDRLLLLDLSTGDTYYGTLYASADGSVSGPLDAMHINVSARTAPGCTLTVPIDDQRQVRTLDYITFVSDDPAPPKATTRQRKNQQLLLDLDLSLTPDLTLNLPMDFSNVGVKVQALGAGDMHLALHGSEPPSVVGDYEITSGTMKLGLLSIIDKTFSLEEGSSLTFPGNIEDARFDLSAVYSQRVNMSTLTGTLSDVSGTQKYLQVDDIINISGSLQDPAIKFDIRLPNADASVEEEVFAYIDRNSERDMLNQSMSLLLNGKFYNANASALEAGTATSGGVGTLASVLTDMVTVVDIDVDYKTGNELVRDQLDVNISKDWGRWYLESTLGYGGESRELADGTTNTAVVDALLGYRLSQLVHLYAYNRTNTNDYTRLDLPYKQGVGLKLTKDFDRWSDLFRHNSH